MGARLGPSPVAPSWMAFSANNARLGRFGVVDPRTEDARRVVDISVAGFEFRDVAEMDT